MWRRVSCEQPLNTSQPILRLRGNLNQACGVFKFYLRNRSLAEREIGPYSHARPWNRSDIS